MSQHGSAPMATTPPPSSQQPLAVGSGSAATYEQRGGDAPFSPNMADMALMMLIRATFDLFQRSVAAPIDRVMVLTAVEGELVRQGRLPAGGFGGIVPLYRRLWRTEGPTGFLRGVVADAVLTLPSGFVDAFATQTVFAALQRLIPTRVADTMSTPGVVLLSLAATSAAVWVATPYNAIRKTIMTNYMADMVAPTGDVRPPSPSDAPQELELASPLLPEAYRYSTATETAREIYRRKGWGGFYRGAAVEPLTVCVYRSLYLIGSVVISERIQMAYPYAVARGLAFVADIITQPLEVVSRRLLLTASDEKEGRQYRGVIDCAKTIVREEGVTALWAGLRFRLMVSLTSMTISTLYMAVTSSSE